MLLGDQKQGYSLNADQWALLKSDDVTYQDEFTAQDKVLLEWNDLYYYVPIKNEQSNLDHVRDC